MSASPNGSRQIPHAPYKGLVPYTEEDAAVFFGRDSERSIIVANIRSSRFTLLYGPSGVGKSSVVGAGVVYALRQRAKQTLQKRGAPEFAVVYFNQWRDDPIKGLLGAVRDSVQNLLGKTFDDDAAFQAKSLDEQIKTWSERAGGDLLIILDQFEDLFLYHPGEDGPGTFVYEFPRAVTDRDTRANFLVAIREDAVAKLDLFEGRIPTLFENYIRIDHLDRDSARDAIVKPIQEYNAHVTDPAERVEIEPALVEAVLDQVKTGRVSLTETGAGRIRDGGDGDGDEQADASRIETPFLQLVMTRLWDEELRSGSHTLRLETLGKLGGAERIVRTHLDKTLGALPANERAAAAGMFHYLVTPSGTKIAHTARDLAEYTGNTEKKLVPVLEKMSASGVRILRPVAPPPDHLDAPTRYEIFHDVLAPAMLDWRRRYLQQRRNRLIYFGAGAIALVVLLLVGFLVLSLRQQQEVASQKAQEAQDLSRAILSEQPSGSVTAPPSQVALRATAAAVGTSAAAVTCQGGPIINFRSSSQSVAPGAPVVLEWDGAQRVSDVSIAPAIGKVNTQGQQSVEVAQTTTYTLTAEGCGGTTTRSVTINVVKPTVPPTNAQPTATVVPPTPTPVPPTATPLPVATATRRPPTPTIPPTATQLTAPPSVYLTSLRVDPPQPRAGQPIVFKVGFLNNTDRDQTYDWCVYIYTPDNFPNKSVGNSTCRPTTIPLGASELDAEGWQVNRIGDCVLYLALARHVNPGGEVVTFNKPDNSDNWLTFQLCP